VIKTGTSALFSIAVSATHKCYRSTDLSDAIIIVASYGMSGILIRLILLKPSLARELSAGSDRKSSKNSLVLLSQRCNFKHRATLDAQSRPRIKRVISRHSGRAAQSDLRADFTNSFGYCCAARVADDAEPARLPISGVGATGA
jgi:hypothetical protein